MLTAATPDYLAHISATSRRAVLLSVVPGAEPPAKDLAASATVAFAPVIEVEQQEEGQLEAGSGGRDLQSLVDGSSPVQQQQQTAGGLQFFALPALMHSTATDTAAPQASLTEPVMVAGRRSLLCFNCPQCSPGQFAVAVSGNEYRCFYCPVGFYCDGKVGGYLAKCPESQCSQCAQVCRSCEQSQTACRSASGTPGCVFCRSCLTNSGCRSWPSPGVYACDTCNGPCGTCQACSSPGSSCIDCANCQQKCGTQNDGGSMRDWKTCEGYYTGGADGGGPIVRRLQGIREVEAGPRTAHSTSTAQE
jgi:hypothetical protein